MTETWKDIPTWEGYYQVSDQGQVRSLTRTIPGSDPCQPFRVMKGRILKPATNKKTGYKHVHLSRSGQKPKCYHIHQLVMLAFEGPYPEWAEEIRHLDGYKPNCSYDNLEYSTCKVNAEDRKKHGQESTPLRGMEHPHHILTDDQVRWIRENTHISERNRARELKVSRGAVRYVLNEGWTHI